MLVPDFQSVQDLLQREQDLHQIKYMRYQIRTGRSVSVEDRGVADMHRSGKSQRFFDQQRERIDI